jgi:hypothetical protein
MPEITKNIAESLDKADSLAEKSELVEVLGGEGGNTPVSARLISNPAGTNDYYADSRNAEGKLVIGKKIDYVE